MTHPDRVHPDPGPASSPSTFRVALCQLHFHPATVYRFDDEIPQPLREPVFIHSSQNRASNHILGSLSGKPGGDLVESLGEAVRETYLEFLLRRLTFILRLCRSWNAELVVFPEYSVPGELLLKLEPFARGMNVVFGSHQANRFLQKEGLYTRLGGLEVKQGDSVVPVLLEDGSWTLAALYQLGQKFIWRKLPQPVVMAGGSRLLIVPGQSSGFSSAGDQASLNRSAENAEILLRLYSPEPGGGTEDNFIPEQRSDYYFRLLPAHGMSYYFPRPGGSRSFPLRLAGDACASHVERIGIVDLERDTPNASRQPDIPGQARQPLRFDEVVTFHLIPYIALPEYQKVVETLRGLSEEEGAEWLEANEALLGGWLHHLAKSSEKVHCTWWTRLSRLLNPHVPHDHTERLQNLVGFVPLPPDCPTAVELDLGLGMSSEALMSERRMGSDVLIDRLHSLLEQYDPGTKLTLRGSATAVKVVAKAVRERFSRASPDESLAILRPPSPPFRLLRLALEDIRRFPQVILEGSARVSETSDGPGAIATLEAPEAIPVPATAVAPMAPAVPETLEASTTHEALETSAPRLTLETPATPEVADASAIREPLEMSGNGETTGASETQPELSTLVAAGETELDTTAGSMPLDSAPLEAPNVPSECGQWIVLLGDNGTGKTTLLQALVLALMSPQDQSALLAEASAPFIRVEQTRAKVEVSFEWERGQRLASLEIVSGSGREVPEDPAPQSKEDETAHDPKEGQADAYREAEDEQSGASSSVRDDASFEASSTPTPLPVYAYGSHRSRGPEGPNQEASTPLRNVSSLFDPTAPLIGIEAWLTRMAFLAEKHRSNSKEGGTNQSRRTEDGKRTATRGDDPEQFLNAVLSALYQVLPDVKCIEFGLEGYWEVKGDKMLRTRLSALSDGYLTTAGWVLDLIARYADRARQDGIPLTEGFTERMTGLVVIDELDLHLHPHWQTRIIRDLRGVFPRMSFVVTTHNPLTLLGTQPGEVFVLSQNPETGAIDLRQQDLPPAIRADQVLTGPWFQLSSTLDQGTLDLLECHRLLLRAGKPETDPERLRLEAELRQRMGTFAETSIERLALSIAAEETEKAYPELSYEERTQLQGRLRQRLSARLRQKVDAQG